MNYKLNKSHRLPMMLFLAAFLLIAASGNAQGLTGQILDGKNSPVRGAAVAVKGGESVTTADDGSFTLSASADDVITVSHPDYLYKEMKVGRVGAKGLTVHVERRFVDNQRDLTGPFGENIDRDSYLGSASTVYGKDLEKYLSTDILTGLQGRIAGFSISQYRGSHIANISSNSRVDLIGSLPS